PAFPTRRSSDLQGEGGRESIRAEARAGALRAGARDSGGGAGVSGEPEHGAVVAEALWGGGSRGVGGAEPCAEADRAQDVSAGRGADCGGAAFGAVIWAEAAQGGVWARGGQERDWADSQGAGPDAAEAQEEGEAAGPEGG